MVNNKPKGPAADEIVIRLLPPVAGQGATRGAEIEVGANLRDPLLLAQVLLQCTMGAIGTKQRENSMLVGVNTDPKGIKAAEPPATPDDGKPAAEQTDA